MAKDAEAPTSADKGKGKAVEGEAAKPKEVKKDKDGKPVKEEEAVVGGRMGPSSLLLADR